MARAATEPPPMTATVVPSKVAATSAVERGGMANEVVDLMGLVVIGLVENARGLWWLGKPRGEVRVAEKAISVSPDQSESDWCWWIRGNFLQLPADKVIRFVDKIELGSRAFPQILVGPRYQYRLG